MSGLRDALRRSPRARWGLGLFGTFVLLATLGPLCVGDPGEMVARPLLPPSVDHWLGTTGQGQDVLAQTVAGARWSLTIGCIVGVLVTALGALVGVPAGYFGGKVDEGLSVLMNVFLVLPGLPLAIVLAALLPVLSNLREASNRAREMAAARSLMVAWTQYAHDSAGAVLPGYRSGLSAYDAQRRTIAAQTIGITANRWVWRLAPYLGHDFTLRVNWSGRAHLGRLMLHGNRLTEAVNGGSL